MILATVLLPLLIIISLSGCQTDYEPQKNSVKTSSYEDVEPSLLSFQTVLDSVNKSFAPTHSRNAHVQAAVIALADVSAGTYGAHIGGYIGGAAGAATGNPFLAGLGYTMGRYVVMRYGSNLLASVASGVASYAYSSVYNHFIRAPRFTYNLDITANCTDRAMDSIGYVHNRNMIDLIPSLNSYPKGIFAPTLNTVATDVFNKISLTSEVYNLNINVEENEITEMQRLCVNLASQIGVKVQDFVSGRLTYEKYVDELAQVITTDGTLTDNDVYIFTQITAPIVEIVAEMEEDDVPGYAKEINRQIWNSNMSDDLKRKIAITSIIAVNSTLIWSK